MPFLIASKPKIVITGFAFRAHGSTCYVTHWQDGGRFSQSLDFAYCKLIVLADIPAYPTSTDTLRAESDN